MDTAPRKPCITMGRPEPSVNLRPCKTSDMSPESRARGRRRPLRYPKTREPDGIRVTSIRKNAQGLTGQWHTVLSPFLHTMLGNGPERGLKIELRPRSSNPEHRPIVIDGTTADWEIVGVVVGAMIGARPTTGC